jgi:RsiW-degrading membrane proteinase PrsW (M82 family)
LVWFLPALLPALFWLWLIWSLDRHEPEPLRWVLLCFATGMLAAEPTAWVENQLLPFFASHRPAFCPPGSLASALWMLVVPVAAVEEGIKFLAFWLVMRRCSELDEPLDGLVYGAATALGFAGVENYSYVLRTDSHPLVVILMRSITAVVLHAGLTGMLGMAYARVRLGMRQPWMRLFWCVFLVILLHTTYDALGLRASSERNQLIGRLMFLTAYLIGLLTALRFRYGLQLSPRFHGSKRWRRRDREGR